jgi:glutamate transport system permease protein
VDVVLDNLDLLRGAFWVTLQLAVLSFVLAFVLGVVLATMRVSPVAPLRAAGLIYVETFRNTPLPALLVLGFFGMPKLGIRGSSFATAVVVVAVYHAAYVCETVRAGINSVAAGQAEAARSIGLTFGQSLRLVILPQAIRSVVPPLGSLFIAQTKNTSMAAAISVAELTAISSRLITEYARPVAILFGVALAYMVITFPAGFVFDAIERKVRIVR